MLSINPKSIVLNFWLDLLSHFNKNYFIKIKELKIKIHLSSSVELSKKDHQNIKITHKQWKPLHKIPLLNDIKVTKRYLTKREESWRKV